MQLASVTKTREALQFKLDAFEGPLDLLLHLIREHRIDIYDIPIAQITDQYLEYIENIQTMDLVIAGEYIVMAATLLEIKSRLLLPSPPKNIEVGEEIDPRAELVQRLLEYQKYQGTVDTLREWETFRRNLYFRGALENPDDHVLPTPAGEMHVGLLVEALQRILNAAGVQDDAVTAVMPKRRVSLRMKMVEVIRKVSKKSDGLEFEFLFELPCPRYEIVLTFLALLELLKLGKIRAEQDTHLTAIILFSIENQPE